MATAIPPASANDEGSFAWPTRWVDQPITSPAGLGRLDGNTLGISLTRRQAGEPIFSPLELYYGYDDKITFTLLHDRGLCWSSPCSGYEDARAGAQYSLIQSTYFDAAASGSLDFASFSDPFAVGIRAGLAAKGRYKRFALVFAPELYVGAIGRSRVPDRLFLPVEAGWQFSPRLVGKLQTGWRGPLSDFSDAVEIPVGVGVDYRWTDHIEIGTEFLFENFFGRGATFDRRVLFFRLNIFAQFPALGE